MTNEALFKAIERHITIVAVKVLSGGFIMGWMLGCWIGSLTL